MTDWRSRLAIVSDEASDSFTEAVNIALPLGIRAYEIRGLNTGRFPDVGDEDIEAVLAAVQAHGLTVIGVSPGFFKHTTDDPQTDITLQTKLPDAFRLMDRLGVRRLTIFSFKREGGRSAPIPDRVLEYLSKAARLCQHEGVQMLIENSASTWGDTGANLGYLAQTLSVPIVWDPGNAAAAGETAYPDGYQAVRDSVAHVHFKNWLPQIDSVAINEGVVDLAAQVVALKADRYPGYYCVEPHQWDNREAAVQINTRQLLALLEETAR